MHGGQACRPPLARAHIAQCGRGSNDQTSDRIIAHTGGDARLTADQAYSLRVIEFQVGRLRYRRACAWDICADLVGRVTHIIRFWASFVTAAYMAIGPRGSPRGRRAGRKNAGRHQAVVSANATQKV